MEYCRTAEYEDARAELMKITGVGVKVADCVLLFGLHRVEAFPVDVWMKRAMEKLFPGLQPSDFGPCRPAKPSGPTTAAATRSCLISFY